MPSVLPEPQPHLANVRDLADAAAGLRPGVAYRSDAPQPGDDTPAGLEPWPPATVIDMRGASEKAHDHVLAESSRIVDLAVLDEADLTGEQARETLTSLESLYAHMTQGAPAAALARGVAEIARSEAPILFHCSAGKDRTGVLAALLLSLLGVGREAIVADYAATAAHMPGVIARMMRGVRDDFREAAMARVPAEVFDAPAHAIESVLERWDDEGGAESWYLAHGGDQETLDRLRERLLAA